MRGAVGDERPDHRCGGVPGGQTHDLSGRGHQWHLEKRVNSGITWNPIFDDQPDYSIGDVAIAPTDPDIIWVGTGEANFRQNVDSGFGIYKSEDGGKSGASAIKCGVSCTLRLYGA